MCHDLSREGKTTSYLWLETMSGFHSAHDHLTQEEGGKKEGEKKNINKEIIQARNYIYSGDIDTGMCECSESDRVLFH